MFRGAADGFGQYAESAEHILELLGIDTTTGSVIMTSGVAQAVDPEISVTENMMDS